MCALWSLGGVGAVYHSIAIWGLCLRYFIKKNLEKEVGFLFSFWDAWKMSLSMPSFSAPGRVHCRSVLAQALLFTNQSPEEVTHVFANYFSSNKCHASSNRCLTSSNKKLVETRSPFFLFFFPAMASSSKPY